MLEKLINVLNQNNMESAWIMIYFVDQVLLGRFKEGRIVLTSNNYNENNILEIHLFNTEKELRSGSDCDFVLIQDPENEMYYFTEKFFILDDVKDVEVIDEQIITTLGRNGRIVKIPMELKGSKPRLVVHHLFDEKTGTIKGYRLVDIEGGE